MYNKSIKRLHVVSNEAVPTPLDVVAPSGEQDIMALYGGTLVEEDRLQYPASAELAMVEQQTLLQNLTGAKEQGKHLAIVDGAFDVPHDNHTWYLREARRLAAQRHFGPLFLEATPYQQRAMVASDDIVLIVTLDADAKIAAMKGFRPEKGGVARPVYNWGARANRIGGFMIPNGNGAYRPILDLVTVEGDPDHQGTMFESHLMFGHTLARQGLLDTWVLFDEHGATVDAATSCVGGRSIISIVPQQNARFAVDPRSGRYWTSSGIIGSIIGNAA